MTPLLSSQVILALIFVAGLCVGSFLNVVIYRLPLGTFWKQTRSHCPHCGALIPWYLNLPVISYLFLSAKSKCCGQNISIQYPLVEILTAIALVISYNHLNVFFSTLGTPRFSPEDAIRLLHAWIFISALIVASTIDIKSFLIPDKLTFPMILVAPVMAGIHPDLRVSDTLWGIAWGAAIPFFIAWIYFLIRKREGLGLGDVKLLAMIGGWLGAQSIFATLLVASICGSLFGLGMLLMQRRWDGQLRLPFGPFLSFAAFTHLIWGDKLHQWFRF